MVVTTSLVTSIFFIYIHFLNTANTYLSYTTISSIIISMFFLHLFCITKKILISIRLYCVLIKTLAIIGLAVMFCIKQLAIVNFSFHKSVCTLKIPNIKRKWRKSLSIIGLEPTTSLIRGQYLNHCATDVNIYILTYASVAIHSIIYIYSK